MSLRSYTEQTRLEDAEYRKTAEHRAIERDAWKLSRIDVERAAPCGLHVSAIGYACMKYGGTFYVCKERRIAAAYKLAGIERP